MIKRITLLLIISVSISIGFFLFFNAPPGIMQSEDFIVKPGTSINRAARNLKQMNMVRSEKFFRALSYILMSRHIRSGKYHIHRGMTSMEIFSRLSSGKIITRKVTIPEGFNLYQIAERLDEGKICSGGKFLHHAFNRSFLSGIGIGATSAEGYLFPDTYVFPEAADSRDIIMAMFKKMKRVLGEVRAETGLPSKIKRHELLILSSLVEKEAKVTSERKTIAAVFHNRLERNWRMDCDPTVRYAVKKFTGSITYRDLASDSPYNTYRHRGLPPTPICSPGRASILAALKPEKSDYLFFVARNDGSHYFSKTLRRHNRAVKHYQRGEKVNFRDDQL